MLIGLHVKYPLILFDFNETGIFSTDFRKMFKYQKFNRKSVQWEPSCSMQTGGRPDMTSGVPRNFVRGGFNKFS